MLGKIFLFYHRDFAKEYIPKLHKAVKTFILNAPDTHIRNVRKETIEMIVNRLNDLLKRTLSAEDREREIAELNLEIALLCIKSQYLERRIHGIKVIDDLVKELRYTSSSSQNAINPEAMVKWIIDHKILDIVFNPKTFHVQLVQ